MATRGELDVMIQAWGEWSCKKAGSTNIFYVETFKQQAPKTYEEMTDEFETVLNRLDAYRRIMAGTTKRKR